MAPTPKQAIDGLPGRLADDVPHCDLDPADRRHYCRAALILVPDHATDHGLNIKGISFQNLPLDPFVENRLNGFFLPFQRRLAHAG